MITKMTAYQSSDGKFVGTIEDVQRHELLLLLKPLSHERTVPTQVEQVSDIQLDVAIKQIVEQRDKVVDILTTGPKSRPKARTANGATRTKKSRVKGVDATASPATIAQP